MSAIYTVTIGINLLFLLVMVFIVRGDSLLARRQKAGFLSALFLIMLVSVAEWLGVFLNGTDPQTRWLHITAKVVEFSCAPVIAYCVGDPLCDNKPNPVLFVIAGIHVLTEIVSGFFGFIFSVDSANFYHRESFYWIYIANYIVSILYLFRRIMLFSRKYKRYSSSMVFLVCFFLIGTTSIQIIDSSLRVAWLTTGMTAALLCITFSTMLHQVDSVTMVLNRSCYETAAAGLRGDAWIILFDINHFKTVNDTWGHPYGDTVLYRIGQLLNRVYAEAGHVYRIGGDEFCAILKLQSDVGGLNRELMRLLDEARLEDPKLPDLSVGYTRFAYGRETVVEAIDRADADMYHDKRNIQ